MTKVTSYASKLKKVIASGPNSEFRTYMNSIALGLFVMFALTVAVSGPSSIGSLAAGPQQSQADRLRDQLAASNFDDNLAEQLRILGLTDPLASQYYNWYLHTLYSNAVYHNDPLTAQYAFNELRDRYLSGDLDAGQEIDKINGTNLSGNTTGTKVEAVVDRTISLGENAVDKGKSAVKKSYDTVKESKFGKWVGGLFGSGPKTTKFDKKDLKITPSYPGTATLPGQGETPNLPDPCTLYPNASFCKTAGTAVPPGSSANFDFLTQPSASPPFIPTIPGQGQQANLPTPCQLYPNSVFCKSSNQPSTQPAGTTNDSTNIKNSPDYSLPYYPPVYVDPPKQQTLAAPNTIVGNCTPGKDCLGDPEGDPLPAPGTAYATNPAGPRNPTICANAQGGINGTNYQDCMGGGAYTAVVPQPPPSPPAAKSDSRELINQSGKIFTPEGQEITSLEDALNYCADSKNAATESCKKVFQAAKDKGLCTVPCDPKQAIHNAKQLALDNAWFANHGFTADQNGWAGIPGLGNYGGGAYGNGGIEGVGGCYSMNDFNSNSCSGVGTMKNN